MENTPFRKYLTLTALKGGLKWTPGCRYTFLLQRKTEKYLEKERKNLLAKWARKSDFKRTGSSHKNHKNLKEKRQTSKGYQVHISLFLVEKYPSSLMIFLFTKVRTYSQTLAQPKLGTALVLLWNPGL